MNLRRSLITGLLKTIQSGIPAQYDSIKKTSLSAEDRLALQNEKLELIVRHAAKNVPYYKEIFSQLDVREISTETLKDIPLLGKSELRSSFSKLQSTSEIQGVYENSSGGSTGEPVKFMQDKTHYESDVATTLYMFERAGKVMGDRELKLWGSERDIFDGSIGTTERLKNFLYNRASFNSFRMNDIAMARLYSVWNTNPPTLVWSYVDSIYEFAKYLSRTDQQVPVPKAIVTTAGSLHEPVKKFLGEIFHCPVLNQYGSREVGVLGCEVPNEEGLELYEWKHFVEILDDQGQRCPLGVEGNIVITTLDNYVMPLIRFSIGDRGVMMADGKLTRLRRVLGRNTDHFQLRDGTLIHGEYFTHLFYFKAWVKKFRVRQTDYDNVVCEIVAVGTPEEKDMADIRDKIRLVMQQSCDVSFKFVPDIPPVSSGKYLYTICEIPK